MIHRSLLVLVLLSGLSACATTNTVRVTSPMSAEDERVFDQAVDYVGSPDDLGGTWASQAHAEVDARVARADVVAVVVVRAVNADTDSRGTRTAHIDVAIEQRLRGDADGTLSLTVGERVSGFDTVDRHERQLLEQRFVAFVKWARADGGSVVARWHLSPASEPVVADVRRAIRAAARSTTTP